MKKPKVVVFHTFWLSNTENDEMIHVACRKWGIKQGIIQQAVHEAIIQWTRNNKMNHT